MAKAATKKPMTKSELLNAISEDTDLTRRDVKAVFESLEKNISRSLGRRGAGMFTLPGPGQDREAPRSGAQGPQGRAQPLQARRADGHRGQAGHDEDQAAGAQGLKDMV